MLKVWVGTASHSVKSRVRAFGHKDKWFLVTSVELASPQSLVVTSAPSRGLGPVSAERPRWSHRPILLGVRTWGPGLPGGLLCSTFWKHCTTRFIPGNNMETAQGGPGPLSISHHRAAWWALRNSVFESRSPSHRAGPRGSQVRGGGTMQGGEELPTLHSRELLYVLRGYGVPGVASPSTPQPHLKDVAGHLSKPESTGNSCSLSPAADLLSKCHCASAGRKLSFWPKDKAGLTS